PVDDGATLPASSAASACRFDALAWRAAQARSAARTWFDRLPALAASLEGDGRAGERGWGAGSVPVFRDDLYSGHQGQQADSSDTGAVTTGSARSVQLPSLAF